MVEYLINLVGRLGHWGYLIIFLGAMLESAAFLGIFVPGESLVLVGGFLAAQGTFDLDALIIIIAAGAALGDSIGYELGRRLGRSALTRYGGRFGLNEQRIAKTDAFFDRHGGKAVFLGRFVGFARALVPFLAGSSQMRYRKFLPYNLIGAALWSAVITLLGYFLGASWQRAASWIGRASAILGGLILFGLFLVWLWRWMVHHEAAIRQWWLHFLAHPKIAALRRRFNPQIAFIEARLSPQGYLGLSVTMGALILIGASWLFGGVAEDVVTGDPLTIVDVWIATWLHQHASPLLTQLMLVVSNLHGTIAVCIYVLLLSLFLIWKHRIFWFQTLMLAVPGGMLINVLMKEAFQRSRPSLDHPLLTLTTYSFPSGHVAGGTLFYGFIAVMAISQISDWSHRVAIVMWAFAIIVLIAFSRLYLGVHYLSDVLAAFAEGIAWLAICITGMHMFRQHYACQANKADTDNQV